MKEYTIIVQIKMLGGYWGGDDELDFRHKLEMEFDDLFKNLKNGYCDGGQIGGGTMEIFICDVRDIDFGLDVVLAHLKSKQMTQDYKVVWRVADTIVPYTVAFATIPTAVFSFDWFDFE